MPTYKVYRPTPDAWDTESGLQLASRPDSLEGKTVGLLFNAKVNADVYLRRIQELVADKYAGTNFVFRSKPTASKPAAPDVLKDMQSCDVVVNAFGD